MKSFRTRCCSLSAALFCTVVALAPALAAGAELDATDSERAAMLRDRLKLVSLQQERWTRVVATQEALARHPDQLSRLAGDAAADMRGTGRDMMVEGLSDGLGGVLSLEAAYAHRVEPIARQFKQGAAGVEFAYQVFVKDRIGDKKAGDPKPEELIDKVNATVKLGAEFIPDPAVRDMIGTMLPLTKGAMGFLGAYLRGDQQEMDKTFESTKSLLEGTLAMLGALSQNPAKLQGAAGAIAREYPAFGAAAGFMATTALSDFNIALGLAKISFGAYGMWQGYELDNQAEAIFEQQQKAVVLLQRLLPRAQQEIRLAQEEEARLQAELDAIEKRQKPPLTVLPSQRFIDDGVAAPVRWANLLSTMDVVLTLPEVTSGMTEALKRRLEEEERQRQEAAAEAEEQREAAAQESERQRSYAEERQSYYANPARARAAISSVAPGPCYARGCPGSRSSNFDATGAVNRIIDEINRQGGGTLGLIQHPR